MSTMQEDGINKLSQAFDRMEVNLLTLREGQDGYENDIEVSLQYEFSMSKSIGPNCEFSSSFFIILCDEPED